MIQHAAFHGCMCPLLSAKHAKTAESSKKIRSIRLEKRSFFSCSPMALKLIGNKMYEIS